MKEKLESVLVLQERDQRVAHLTKELARIPQELATLDRDLAQRNTQFEEKRTKARHVETERRKLELEVKTLETQLNKYKTQQQTTRKNEEFAALNHEIAHVQVQISGVEDRELVLMEQYDVEQALVKEAQVELDKYKATHAEKRKEVEKRQAHLESELVHAKQKQAAAEVKVEESLLGRYRRIMKSKGDAAVVKAEHGVCSGCHMKLTAQTWVNSQKIDEITTCDNCGRIVFAMF